MDKPRGRLTADELMAAYQAGKRDFWHVNLDAEQLSGVDLRGASFFEASLRGAMVDGAELTHVQLKGADLTGASLSGARLVATDLIWADFTGADLSYADLTGAALNHANCTDANLTRANLGNARLQGAILELARLDRIYLSSTSLDDVDVRPFCDAKSIKHEGPSSIDFRTVMKSYRHPGIKRFMLDCGVSPIFAEYMIDCAHAVGEPLLRSIMRSTFISYGSPDEAFARRLYETLRDHGVLVFYFPETAAVGERIDNEVYRRLQQHDRIVLICSRSSLDRPGVLNEIQETLDREAQDGGATYLLPIMLDDYVLKGWKKAQPELAERVGRRVVADFRKAARNRQAFDAAVARLLDALKLHGPAH